MVITYQGDNYFKIQSGESVVLIDPTNTRSFKGANVVLNTIKPATIARPEEEGVFWIENQGEYEREGIRVEGWSTSHKDGVTHTAYQFTMEGIEIAVLGHLTNALAPDVIEKLQDKDILIVPGSGAPYIAPGDIAKTIRQIEPGMVIPSLIKAAPKKLFDELNVTPTPEEKITIKKKDVSPGAMEVRYLKGP